MEIRGELEDVIMKDLEALKNFEGDEKERERIVKEVSVLSKSLDDSYRSEAEQYNKEQQLELDKAKAKSEKKRFWISRGIELFGTTAYLIVANKVLKVEDTGTVTTKVFQFLQKPKTKI